MLLEEVGIFVTGGFGHVSEAIDEAIKLAKSQDCAVALEFNEVLVRIEADSNPDLIFQKWSKARE